MIDENKKIYDCFTFYDENFLVNSRFEILNDVVDYFVISESKFDHLGNKKKLNFKLLNNKFKNKLRYIVIEEQFPDPKKGWENEKYQREKLNLGIMDATDSDYIMYSDSDEIPNPDQIKSLSLKNDYGIFMQKCFVFKLNIFNQYESPWEGTRVCKKKKFKSFTHLRKKILKKNIFKPFWKFNTIKKIDILDNGGWHFNNLYSPEKISQKLKVFPHQEFNSKEYTDIEKIKNKINNLQDLFGRGHTYQKVKIDETYPTYFFKNANNLKNYIL